MTTRHAHIALLLAATVVVAACGSGTGSPGARTASSPGRSAPLWASPGAAALPTAYQDSLQTSLDGWVERGKLVGATAAVVTPAGVWAGAAGVDGAGTTLQPDSAMSIASTTKTFTAAEVMLLASRGLVDLDKPLSTYVDVPFDTKGATVRQVLAMRSGFPDYSTKQFQRAIATDLDRDWTPTEMLAALPADTKRVGVVGGTPHYNDLGYVLLGDLIKNVTRKSVAQAIRSDLLDPAGLNRIWVQTAETPTAPLSVGTDPPHTTLVDPAGPYLPSRSAASFTSMGGGMAGEAADLARWGYLLYGGHVIDAALVKQMEANPQEEPTKGPYALGTMITQDDSGTVMVGHGGGGLDWPYSTVMEVWTGTPPVAVVVITPQPADFGKDLYELVMNLHQDVAAIPVTTSASTS